MVETVHFDRDRLRRRDDFVTNARKEMVWRNAVLDRRVLSAPGRLEKPVEVPSRILDALALRVVILILSPVGACVGVRDWASVRFLQLAVEDLSLHGSRANGIGKNTLTDPLRGRIFAILVHE